MDISNKAITPYFQDTDIKINWDKRVFSASLNILRDIEMALLSITIQICSQESQFLEGSN